MPVRDILNGGCASRTPIYKEANALLDASTSQEMPRGAKMAELPLKEVLRVLP